MRGAIRGAQIWASETNLQARLGAVRYDACSAVHRCERTQTDSFPLPSSASLAD